MSTVISLLKYIVRIFTEQSQFYFLSYEHQTNNLLLMLQKSNPMSEEEYLKPARSAVEPKSQSVFQEQIRAERESFKAVFDKRRQRIGGFNVDEE